MSSQDLPDLQDIGPARLFANPADDPFGMDESDLTSYAVKKLLETRDLTWYGYYPIAKSYLRAITLLHSLDGVGSGRAVLLGNGWGGAGGPGQPDRASTPGGAGCNPASIRGTAPAIA